MFWILEKSDSAILGWARGSKSQRVISGPFDSYDKAMEEKSKYRRWGCTYYAITEADSRPKDTQEDYEFVDAYHEFDDVGGW